MNDGKDAISALREVKEGQFRVLPKEIRRDGFDYRQIAREGDIAIYEQSWSGAANPNRCFEVIRIRVDPRRQIRGKWLDAGERYPGSNDWGTFGWTYTNEEQAFTKFNQLKKEQ